MFSLYDILYNYIDLDEEMPGITTGGKLGENLGAASGERERSVVEKM